MTYVADDGEARVVFIGDTLFLRDSVSARRGFLYAGAAVPYRSIPKGLGLPPPTTRLDMGHDEAPAGLPPRQSVPWPCCGGGLPVRGPEACALAWQAGRKRAVLRVLLAAIIWLTVAAASGVRAEDPPRGGTPPRVATTADPAASQSPRRSIEVFVRDGCPHCADAKAFLAQLQQEHPDVEVLLRPVDTDAAARDRLTDLFRAAGEWPPGVPTFVVNRRVLIGFDDAEHRGRELRAMLDPAAAAPAEAVDGSLLGGLSVNRLGLPMFTLALGLLDGVNPCAMWVLLFLLSLLVRLQNRRRMALIAGTFVLVSGAIYYAFMAAWLNVFLAVGFSGPVRLGLALLALAIGVFNVKDSVWPGHGPSLAIPASARPGLAARMARLRETQALPAMLLGVATLAIVVNLVELLCTAGLPAVYTAVLTQQGLSPAAHYAYLGLYILGYIADDGLMVGVAVIALGSGKLGERGGRVLKLLSGSIMLVLGAVLMLRPQWLI